MIHDEWQSTAWKQLNCGGGGGGKQESDYEDTNASEDKSMKTTIPVKPV